MTIDFTPSPNFSSRRGEKITAIIIHHTATRTLEAALNIFRSAAEQVSAHYVIAPNGTVVQMVKNEDKAWHAGRAHLHGLRTSVNACSIGIELVNPGDGETAFPTEQMEATACLLGGLMKEYGIIWHDVLGHRDVALPAGRKVDPADNFDWELLRHLVFRKV